LNWAKYPEEQALCGAQNGQKLVNWSKTSKNGPK
jgi:hypothetical protein